MNSRNNTEGHSVLIQFLYISDLLIDAPFTVIIVFISIFFIRRLWMLSQHSNPEDGFERKKDKRIKILVLKFIIIILLIEFSSNLCGMLSGIVYGFVPIFDKNDISPLNNCRTNEEVDFIMQLFPRGWFAYLPTMLHISIVQFLQPTVSLLLNVLRRAYLDRPYRAVIKRWMCIILLRSCIFITLQIFYQTIYISFLMLPLFYIIDFKVYLTHSRRFYSLLKSRMEIARLHSCREEYQDKSMVFLQHRVTSSYTTLIFSILTLKYSIAGIRYIIHGSIRILCTFHSITLGYSPLIFYNLVTRQVLNRIELYFFFALHLLEIVLQLLISLAYVLVCIGIGIRLYIQMKNYKHINTIIRPLIIQYRSTVYY